MEMRVRRAGAAGALAAVLLLAGCSANDGGEQSSSRAGVAQDAVAPQAGGAATPGKGAATGGSGAGAAASAGTDTAAGAGSPAVTNRQIAYQAKLTVRVDAVDQARGKAVALVLAADGYVSGENLRGGSGDSMQATLVLKVPSAAYQQTLDGLGRLGTRLSLSSQADDLTQQIADVDSRVKSMKASVDRVRALMADAKSLAEVVSLESELTRRESDLESLQRQQQELTARTSLSTVTLDLVPASTPAPPVPAGHDDGFWHSVGDALSGGWEALVGLVRVLLMVLAALAPFLLILVPLGWLLRRYLRARPKPQQFSAPSGPDRGPVGWAVPPQPAHSPDETE
ncbi:DUF4349 domain-containing protein [Streptomyces sp. TLI_171]|uniref:DUF4349 domain-containing protein n=1 Tax=Streptomyces sp. TLI_171 TaxID=1938859 RepID=UPI000C1949DF|nr:DUF4349 domain-containing protein [Streptomyces sp. TLI_171]RKE21642.1 uncharacterized protein DUF4349 [Streptomyces sp. TLI_171]